MEQLNLPNFFILGAAKSGSSSLYFYLKQHPEIFLSPIKEPHFFDNDKNYRLGVETYLDRYFKESVRYRARGEATPAYFHHPRKVIPRIKEVYLKEEPRFIIILRNPVHRAFSHYLHRVRLTQEDETFERALELEDFRLKKSDGEDWVGYYSDGLYAQLIRTWLSNFSKTRFKFLLLEELIEEKDKILKEIFHFLKIDDSVKLHTQAPKNIASETRSKRLMKLINDRSLLKLPFKMFIPQVKRRKIKEYIRKKNVLAYEDYPTVDYNTKNMLMKKYQNEIKQLEEIINKDLSAWLN
jgi:hypothetical protein